MLKQFNATSSPRQRLASQEYSRILSAAVINTSFRCMLLKDPAKAVSAGYSGEKFDLRTEDRKRLIGIQADSLVDFASKLTEI